jgi:hypothetical protein
MVSRYKYIFWQLDFKNILFFLQLMAS